MSLAISWLSSCITNWKSFSAATRSIKCTYDRFFDFVTGLPLNVFLGKGVLKIWSKFTRQNTCQQLYWNYTSEWVFSCKFASYFQNIFLWEHLRIADSESKRCKRLTFYISLMKQENWTQSEYSFLPYFDYLVLLLILRHSGLDSVLYLWKAIKQK